MADNIKEFNKQIASFILMSAALAIPAVSASETADNNLIADASAMLKPAQSNTAELMVFYGAPQIPTIRTEDPTRLMRPMVFYAAPQAPDTSSVIKVDSPMVFYGAPQIPNTPAIKVDPPMAFYAAPQIPEVNVINKVEPSPMVFYGAPQIPKVPVNVIEKQVVPMPVPSPEQMQSVPSVNDSGIQGTSSGTAAQSLGIKTNTAKGTVKISPYSKTNDFVFSEYGNVKIVEPFAHFIFR